MTDESSSYSRLAMLDECGGEIEGRKKYHKLMFLYRDKESDKEDWAFNRSRRGPTDPGFTSVLQAFEDLDMTELENDEHPYKYVLKKKGERFIESVKRHKKKINFGENPVLEGVKNIADNYGHMSGAELVKEEEIQKAKEKEYDMDV